MLMILVFACNIITVRILPKSLNFGSRYSLFSIGYFLTRFACFIPTVLRLTASAFFIEIDADDGERSERDL